MSVSERLLRIIERVGILVALTFDNTRNETQNATFEGSHIGKFSIGHYFHDTYLSKLGVEPPPLHPCRH